MLTYVVVEQHETKCFVLGQCPHHLQSTVVKLQTMTAENHSEQASEAEPDVPPAIPSRPEHTKSKVLNRYTSDTGIPTHTHTHTHMMKQSKLNICMPGVLKRRKYLLQKQIVAETKK